jgi:hypothetical protein
MTTPAAINSPRFADDRRGIGAAAVVVRRGTDADDAAIWIFADGATDLAGVAGFSTGRAAGGSVLPFSAGGFIASCECGSWIMPSGSGAADRRGVFLGE